MAAGRNLNAKFILSLRDGVSAGLGALKRRLDGLANAGRRIGLLGAGIAGLSFAGPAQQAAAFETQLRDIEITAGRTGIAIEAAMRGSREELFRLALQTRTASTELLEAKNVLTARGLEPEQIAAFLPVIADVTGASGAAARDLAQLTTAYSRNLAIGGELMRLAQAMSLRGGQLGGFELRDSARYVPGLAAQISSLKVTGLEAVQTLSAGLQVVREGFGTTEEAAAGFQQLIGHLLSEHTQSEMAKFGVDMRGVFNDAGRQGINRFEAMLEALRRVIAVDPSRAFQVMPDQNTRQALMAFLNGLGRYLDIKRDLASTTPDVIDRNLADRTRGLGADMRKLNEQVAQLSNRLGTAVGGPLPALIGLIESLLHSIKRVDDSYPGVIDKTLAWTAGLALLVGAAATLVPVLGFLASGFALLFSPITLVLGALGLVVWALRDWEGFTAFFSGVWEGIKGSFGSFEAYLAKWRAAFDAVAEALKGPWEALKGFFSDLWGGIEERFARFVASVRAFFGPLLDIIDRVRSRTEEQPGPAQGRVNGRMAGRAHRIEGWDEPEAAVAGGGAPATAELRGRLVIEAAPGLRVRDAASDNPGVEFQGSRGQVLGRP